MEKLDVQLNLLSRLRFVTRRRRRGGSWGERRSTRKGLGIEFADYRDYVAGDDPRRVDWNLYARLDRPYVRLYEEEEDLAVIVLLDGSRSMAWGEDDMARWPATVRLARALGAIALLGGDALRGGLLQGRRVAATWGPGRGRGLVLRWEHWLESLAPAGETAMSPALRDLAARPGRPGLALVLTDGYDPAGLADGVAGLAARGYEVVMLHILTPDELAPTLRGDLRLVDAETGDKREVTVDGTSLAAYHRRLAAWQAELRALAGKHGGRYALIRSDWPLRQQLMDALRRADVLR